MRVVRVVNLRLHLHAQINYHIPVTYITTVSRIEFNAFAS